MKKHKFFVKTLDGWKHTDFKKMKVGDLLRKYNMEKPGSKACMESKKIWRVVGNVYLTNSYGCIHNRTMMCKEYHGRSGTNYGKR